MNDKLDGPLTKPNDPESGESHSYMTKIYDPTPKSIAIATIDRVKNRQTFCVFELN